MSLEDRHWPSLCIIAVVVRSVVVVVVCAEATPVINAVLSNAAAKYFVIIVSSKTVNPTNALARFWFHRGTLSSEVLVVGSGTKVFGIRLSYSAVNQSEGSGNFQELGRSSWEPIVARFVEFRRSPPVRNCWK